MAHEANENLACIVSKLEKICEFYHKLARIPPPKLTRGGDEDREVYEAFLSLKNKDIIRYNIRTWYMDGCICR